MMDYVSVGPSDSGARYALMLVDKFSRMVEFIPTEAPLAVPAARAILRWGARYGLPDWLVTDGGTHFKNHALNELSETMGVQHHITTAYCT